MPLEPYRSWMSGMDGFPLFRNQASHAKGISAYGEPRSLHCITIHLNQSHWLLRSFQSMPWEPGEDFLPHGRHQGHCGRVQPVLQRFRLPFQRPEVSLWVLSADRLIPAGNAFLQA